MTDPNTIAIQLVIDRSGSMDRIKDDMDGAINTYLKNQAAEPGEALVSIAQFDDEYEVVCTDTPVAQVAPYKTVPRNSTALYDAVGRTINSLGSRLAALDEAKRPGKVLFVIVTDGMENASKEYDAARVRDLIKNQTDGFAWQFVYIGANQDAYNVAATMGVARGSTMNYGANYMGTKAVSDSLTANTSRYRSGVTGQAIFSEEEQEAGDASR